jgi:hypothetical protein
VRNQLHDRRIDVKIRKIYGGNAVLAREEIGDVLVGQEAEFNQGAAQAAVLLLLHLDCLLQLFWGDDLLFDKKVAQSLRHTPISWYCLKQVRETPTRRRKGARVRG